MVASSGSYFGGHFKCKYDVAQGYPLSPTICIMLVDTALQHWVTMVEATEETSDCSAEGFGREIQWLVVYFYADNGLLASTQVDRLQWAFNVLTELFDQNRMCTNVVTTVGMV